MKNMSVFFIECELSNLGIYVLLIKLGLYYLLILFWVILFFDCWVIF